MKKIVLGLFLLLTTLQVKAQNDWNFDYPTSEVYSQFVGEWTTVYSSQGEAKTVAGEKGETISRMNGRGESVSKMNLKNTVVEFETEFQFDISEIITKMVIGYDIIERKYFLISYSSSNEPPAVLYGEYSPKKKMFLFKSYEGEPKENDVIVEFEATREDKLTYKTYVQMKGKSELFLSIGFMKK